MEQIIERQETIGDYTIKIVYDSDPMNPRKEYDGHLGKMICLHRRYDLGDKHQLDIDDTKDIVADKKNIYLNLYLYDHSGITMSYRPFSCPWDSGQVGIIYVSEKDALKWFNRKRMTPKLRAKVIDTLKKEVEIYDDYLTGNCFGYIIEDSEGNDLESCWGFLGDADYCFKEAESLIPYLERRKAREQAEKDKITQPDLIQAT